MDLEDEKQPFEFMAEEQSLLRKRPAARPAGRVAEPRRKPQEPQGDPDGFVTRAPDEEDT